jgi:hypothetical protein
VCSVADRPLSLVLFPSANYRGTLDRILSPIACLLWFISTLHIPTDEASYVWEWEARKGEWHEYEPRQNAMFEAVSLPCTCCPRARAVVLMLTTITTISRNEQHLNMIIWMIYRHQTSAALLQCFRFCESGRSFPPKPPAQPPPSLKCSAF